MARAQSKSIPPKMNKVSQIPPKLARRHRRMVARPVAGVRAHNTTTSQHYAVQSVQIVVGMSRNGVGRGGSGGGSNGQLARLSFSAEQVQEQADRLKKAREFVAQAKRQMEENEGLEAEVRELGEEVSVEEEEVEGSDAEWLEGSRRRLQRKIQGLR